MAKRGTPAATRAASTTPTPSAKPAADAPAARGRPSALLDTRVVYCGDCLEQLRSLPDACVDLVYIDPPFNSNRNYEVFWGETKEKRAFEDRHASTQAYIDYMRPRCVELARVLKRAGSFYYHCDWHASHYAKVIVMSRFGADGYNCAMSDWTDPKTWADAAKVMGEALKVAVALGGLKEKWSKSKATKGGQTPHGGSADSTDMLRLLDVLEEWLRPQVELGIMTAKEVQKHSTTFSQLIDWQGKVNQSTQAFLTTLQALSEAHNLNATQVKDILADHADLFRQLSRRATLTEELAKREIGGLTKRVAKLEANAKREAVKKSNPRKNPNSPKNKRASHGGGSGEKPR
jgi:hypothetical protein